MKWVHVELLKLFDVLPVDHPCFISASEAGEDYCFVHFPLCGQIDDVVFFCTTSYLSWGLAGLANLCFYVHVYRAVCWYYTPLSLVPSIKQQAEALLWPSVINVHIIIKIFQSMVQNACKEQVEYVRSKDITLVYAVRDAEGCQRAITGKDNSQII